MRRSVVVFVCGLALAVACAGGVSAREDETPAPSPRPARAPHAAPRPARVPVAPAGEAPPAVAAAPAAPGAPAIPPPAPNQGEPVNIRLEITIADEGGGGAAKKTVVATVADRANGSVRSSLQIPSRGDRGQQFGNLDVDVQPTIVKDGKIRLTLSLDYAYAPAEASGTVTVKERFTLLLQSGKPLVISQSADPQSDRHVSLEVKATIL